MSLSFTLKTWLARSGLAAWSRTAKLRTGGDTRFIKYLSDRTLAAPLDELLDPITFPQADGPDVMNLNLPAPQFESPVGGWRFSADRLGNPHPWGLPELREQIAEQAQTTDTAHEVYITHGATAAYAATLDAFVNPNDKVVLFDPGSPLFAIGAKSRRAKLSVVPTWCEEGRTRYLFDSLAKAMSGAMLLVLSEPSNPTGGTFAADDLEQIAWLANRHDVLVYVDESFQRFRYDTSATRLYTLPKMENRTIVAGSMTQGYGLGSLRVGWVRGHGQLIRAIALNALLSAPYVPTACQQAALRAMQAGRELFTPMLEQFRSKRKYTWERLRTLGLDATWPNGGFSTWVCLAGLGVDGRTFAERLLKESRVLVGPGIAFGESGKDFIRLSFAIEDGRLREGLSRLAKLVMQLRGEPQIEEARISIAEVKPEPLAVKELRAPVFSRM